MWGCPTPPLRCRSIQAAARAQPHVHPRVNLQRMDTYVRPDSMALALCQLARCVMGSSTVQ